MRVDNSIRYMNSVAWMHDMFMVPVNCDRYAWGASGFLTNKE